MTYVKEELVAESDGLCPDCGERVVVEASEISCPPVPNPFAELLANENKMDIPIVDLPISVRCRARLIQLDVNTLGDLAKLTRFEIEKHLPPSSKESKEFFSFLSELGIYLT